jgi:hypothetical protein
MSPGPQSTPTKIRRGIAAENYPAGSIQSAPWMETSGPVRGREGMGGGLAACGHLRRYLALDPGLIGYRKAEIRP